MTKYPEIKAKPIQPNEKFKLNNEELTFSITDFWQWSLSDLVENRNSCVLAEFIVKRALMIDSSTRLEWDSYDLKTVDDCKIEIKSAAYIQAWKQKKKSVIQFDIAPKSGLLEDNNYTLEKSRHADVYIFCHLHHDDQATINPMILNQWTFYLVSTKEINEKLKTQKSVSISTILTLNHEKCDYGSLREKFELIRSSIHKNQSNLWTHDTAKKELKY